MPRKTDKGTVEVEILKPFHIGTDQRVNYRPGDIAEVDAITANRWIGGGYAKYKVSRNNKNQKQHDTKIS